MNYNIVKTIGVVDKRRLVVIAISNLILNITMVIIKLIEKISKYHTKLTFIFSVIQKCILKSCFTGFCLLRLGIRSSAHFFNF